MTESSSTGRDRRKSYDCVSAMSPQGQLRPGQGETLQPLMARGALSIHPATGTGDEAQVGRSPPTPSMVPRSEDSQVPPTSAS